MTREEAIKEIKSWDFLKGKEIEAIQTLIPELAESEDERMLRTIIRGFENWKSHGNLTFNNTKVDNIIAYLEKQKEQKPAEWSDYKDKVNVPYCSSEPEWSEEKYDKISKQVYKAIRRALASLAVYAEDEALLDSKEETLSYYSQQCAEKILKSLRPSWKSCEGQKEAL